MRTAKRASPFFLVAFLGSLLSCSRTVKEPLPVEAEAPAPSASEAASNTSDSRTVRLVDAGGPTLFNDGPLPPDAPFEGMLTMQVVLNKDPTSEEGSEVSTYYFTVKGKKARWDLFANGGQGGPVGYRVYDGEQRKFFTLMRQPVVFTVDEAVLMADAGAPKAWNFSSFKVEPKSSVQGISCDRVVAQDDQYEYSACLAQGLAPIPLHLLGGAMATAIPFGTYLEKRGGLLPLSVIVRPLKKPTGSNIRPFLSTLTTLKADRWRVPDTAFQLPKFQQQETPILIAPGIKR